MERLEGHRARKRFGQNFLHDEHWIQRIADAVRAAPGERIVEIGPGQAALTRKLVAAAGRVTAVEIDRDLAAWLRTQFAGGELELIEADALKLDFGAVAPGEPLRIVGNLPYNISSPLLFHLMQAAGRVVDQHFMLQREVVERMAAAPGSKTYGRLSVMLQWRYRIAKLFDVPPGAFTPAPKVVSSVVRMVPLPEADVPAVDSAVFGAVVQEAFGQRRKTLRNALAGRLTADQIAACGIDPGARAETVPVEGFVRLARLAAESPLPAQGS
ncbi:MAG: 16S rRNA (adenine(1518)-N(6)/adenine(1519)-N(6))-dimethyltransferase RsmA [Duodenibacillus sp.]|nr:16S rRNA (adenine(1518)-N(6)/adenine(1519)-N(6))-dimethyltransferase RsmA [Duodenibacillus sp.]